MAESSIFWTTGGAGDGASTYTQDQLTTWLRRTFLTDPATEGVLKNYANELAPSVNAQQVTIASGAAYVYGFPYESTANVVFSIPVPTTGTTGHRIVLRANYTARTVRLVLLSAADGTATPPAVTQSPGTTWEITIASLTITTGGVITLTDGRAFAHLNHKVASASIDDGAITNTKMADNAVDTAEIVNNAVDDTKVGNRVPQIYRRQGGDTTDWNVAGTSNYTPGAVRVQCGAISVHFAASANVTASVTFPVAFGARPLVFLTLGSGNLNNRPDVAIDYGNEPTTTGFTLHIVTDVGGTFDVIVHWLAIGTE